MGLNFHELLVSDSKNKRNKHRIVVKIKRDLLKASFNNVGLIVNT